MKTFDDIKRRALESSGGPKRLALAASDDEQALLAVRDVCLAGAVQAILVGDESKTRNLCAHINFPVKAAEFVHEDTPAAAAAKAVSIVREDKADLLMKGHVNTKDYLRPVVNNETGIKKSELLSVVVVLEAPRQEKLLFLTDTAMVIQPSLAEKVTLLENAAFLSANLGIESPKAAVLCATEAVNAAMPATTDAAILTAMANRGQIKGVQVDGPMAVDIAVSRHAADIKGVGGQVAGNADILLVPNIEAGNIAIKALRYIGGLSSGAIVMGASVPIIISSRSDPVDIKSNSIYLALAQVRHS